MIYKYKDMELHFRIKDKRKTKEFLHYNNLNNQKHSDRKLAINLQC